MMEQSGQSERAHECHIRDLYAKCIQDYRLGERVVKREAGYKASAIRADLRTVDRDNVLREWEFKIEADYSALGQILTYIAQARLESNFQRTVRGVIAAFVIPDIIRAAAEVNALGIEFVILPACIEQHLFHSTQINDV